MAKFRFLDIARLFISILPDVESPGRSVPFNLKIMFTSLAVLLYLSMSQIKPYGILVSETVDPLYSVRGSLAASHATLTELGVLPILTTAFTMQLLASARVIDVNFSLKEERALFGTAQKLVAIVVSGIQAAALVLSGAFGAPSVLGLVSSLAIIGQLVSASVVIIFLDELLQKGHGLGSGSMLFIGAHACTTSIWSALSLRTINTPHGPQYEGALVAFLQFIFTWNSLSRGLREAFWRVPLPNVLNIVSTLLVIAACSFLQRVRVEFQVKHTRFQGQRTAYPIRLLYTGIVPLMAAATLRANVLLGFAALSANLPQNLIVQTIFGTWETVDGALVPVYGLVSYLVPPSSILKALKHPLHTVGYAAFNIVVCGAFSLAWISASGSEAFHVAKQLQEQQLTLAGHREGSLSKEFKRVIPNAALLGGAIVGAVAVLGDIAGALAGGSGVFMAVMIVQTYIAMGMMESGYADVPGAAMMMDSL